MNDSLGNPDPNAYNAVHWNGQSWELKRIYYYWSCSEFNYPSLSQSLLLMKMTYVVTNGGSIAIGLMEIQFI
ncbi:MAG: hypothetical protein MZV64_54080 [Ignavibacteriales bacterium]|nr:hypothetical protein [Ignavibacteriales bacterium]